ncbi:MAG: TIGR03435 family protein [Bryobacteraceae bacterium]
MRYSTLPILFATALFAQSPTKLEFEVASVKLAAPVTGPGTPRGGPGSADPRHVTYRSLSMKNLLMTAYDLPFGRISGPGWIETDRYDISASLPAGTTNAQLAVMLQNLLAERFHLVVRRETKEVTVFELVIGKNGPKLGSNLKAYVDDPNVTAGQSDKDGHPIPPPGGSSNLMQPGRRRVSARKQPMARLATMLAAELDRPVIDKTGLVGDYDYVLEYAPTGNGAFAMLEGKAGAAGATAELDLPSLQTAVQEQLGLRLESKRGPVEFLVVDGGQKVPTEN